MKNRVSLILLGLFAAYAMTLSSSCASWSKTEKGAVIGAAGGAGAGAIIGRAAGNTALGTVIGAAVGGVAGTIIGHKMDKQAEAIKNKVPDAKVIRIGEGIVVEFNNKVLFGFDQYNLTADARNSLDKLTLVLNEYPETNIEIQGHTDPVGTEKYNLSLSKKRAKSVASYLRGKNIRSSRLTVKAYGERAPVYDNSTADGQALNRRVDFLITANAKMKAAAKKEAGQ
ncbi:MAG TPA: OmpA family protein [Saprospiraceae bacterium]|nr:OmpA family protein [Saprospiraceae bacterium]